MPAVSTNRTGPEPGHSTSESTLSLVVPDTSETTLRCVPTSRLNRLDLPTLGRPTIANRGSRIGSSTRGASGNSSRSRSKRSPAPFPCRAEIGNGSPSPSRWNAATSAMSAFVSALFATTSTGVGAFRSRRASWASSCVMPVCASTTSTIRSASSTAMSACFAASASSPPARCR